MAQVNWIRTWHRKAGTGCIDRRKLAVVLMIAVAALQLCAREKDATQYGVALTVNLPFSESEVTQVVQDVVQNGIIRGTKEYNQDEYVQGANAANTTRAFQEWNEGGKVFYKLRLKALDPRNFKNTNDVGTLAVRYVVQAQGEKNTVLRIDAVFVEDFRHAVHPSNGSVESAEYKDIHDRLESLEAMKAQTLEAERDKQEQLAGKHQPVPMEEVSSSKPVPASAVNVAATEAPPIQNPQTPPQTIEERVHDLRRQVQRVVKAPGAPLKSAPFHSASTLQSLTAGTEVLIVIATPYWFGVETHNGQHGWMLRDELELLP